MTLSVGEQNWLVNLGDRGSGEAQASTLSVGLSPFKSLARENIYVCAGL